MYLKENYRIAQFSFRLSCAIGKISPKMNPTTYIKEDRFKQKRLSIKEKMTRGLSHSTLHIYQGQWLVFTRQDKVMNQNTNDDN